MSNYKKMYIELFNSMTKAIAILQEAQQRAEEIYISSNQPEIRILNITTKKEKNNTPEN